jgi:hypothetical protein
MDFRMSPSLCISGVETAFENRGVDDIFLEKSVPDLEF